jgi:anti-sigma factor ChrR (cupin superfamily)
MTPTESSTEARNRGITIAPDSLPWTEVTDGVEMKVLHLGEELPTWTVLIRFQPGERLPPHIHLAAAELYIVSGSGTHRHTGPFEAGDYIYEQTWADHVPTQFHEETVLLMISYGPCAVKGPDGELQYIMDADFFRRELPLPTPVAR